MKGLQDLVKRLIAAGRTNVDDLSPEDLQKLMKNTSEAIPPSPIGQGSNLDALRAAREAAPDLDAAPAGYPREIFQDDLATPPAPMTKDFTMVPEGTNVPAVIPPKTPGAIVPEVVDAAPSSLPMAMPQASSLPVVAGSARNVTDEVRKRMDPRLAALLGVSTAGGLYMASGEDAPVPEIPMAREKKPQTEAPKSEQIENAPKQVSPVKRAASVEKASAPAPEAAPSAPTDQDIFSRRLLEAQTADSNNQLLAGLMRAGNTIGASLAMTKADQSGVEAIEKNQGQNTKNVKELMEGRASEKKIQQFEKEMADEEKLRDPNSDASKMTRQVLARFGLNVKTAKEAKDAGINVQNILLQEMAANKAKELASMKSAGAVGDKKFVRDLRKEATSGVLGKQYATFSTSQRMSRALDEFQKDPSGYKDYATLMGGLKSLQGDESVVREAEIRMGMSATSLFDSLQNQLQKAANGKLLQPNQRKQMVDTIRILTDISKKQYMQSVQPILEQAEREGIDRELILPGSVLGQEKQAVAPELTTSGEMVKVRRISDGLTKMMSAEKANLADKSKYEIIP